VKESASVSTARNTHHTRMKKPHLRLRTPNLPREPYTLYMQARDGVRQRHILRNDLRVGRKHADRLPAERLGFPAHLPRGRASGDIQATKPANRVLSPVSAASAAVNWASVRFEVPNDCDMVCISICEPDRDRGERDRMTCSMGGLRRERGLSEEIRTTNLFFGTPVTWMRTCVQLYFSG